jgi:hypothetical protein
VDFIQYLKSDHSIGENPSHDILGVKRRERRMFQSLGEVMDVDVPIVSLLEDHSMIIIVVR